MSGFRPKHSKSKCVVWNNIKFDASCTDGKQAYDRCLETLPCKALEAVPATWYPIITQSIHVLHIEYRDQEKHTML
jgi:hypothetical protein